jgi:hypothetical protein
MGYYVNPPGGQSKEEWLDINGTPCEYVPDYDNTRINMAVCLVDNGGFTAAGVAYSSNELECFAVEDGRQKRWYMVPSDKLVAIVPGLPF